MFHNNNIKKKEGIRIFLEIRARRWRFKRGGQNPVWWDQTVLGNWLAGVKDGESEGCDD